MPAIENNMGFGERFVTEVSQIGISCFEGLSVSSTIPDESDLEQPDVEMVEPEGSNSGKPVSEWFTEKRIDFEVLYPEPVYAAPSSSGSGYSGSGYASIRVTGTERYDSAYQLLDLVNQERQNAGLGTLTMNASLTEAAMQRAAEVTVYFDHTRPNGQIALTVSSLYSSYLGGENLGVGYSSMAELMRMLMGSSGHRANILDGRWSSIGIGVFVHEGITYSVQLFCAAPSSTPEQPANVVRSRVVEVNLSVCAFPYVSIIADSSIAAGETKGYRLKLANPRPEVSSWAYCCPDMDYGITFSSSDPSRLQVQSGSMTGLAAGTVTLGVGICGYILATSSITVT